MSNLLKDKNSAIDWTPVCDMSFQTLISMLTQSPVLTIMDPVKEKTMLCTDVGDLAIGAVLMQDKKIVAYESRNLNSAELNYPIHEKKLLTVIYSLKVWRQYSLRV